jgi:hypothetical protein
MTIDDGDSAPSLAPGLHRRSQATLEDKGMDGTRFDSLTRSITALGNRRDLSRTIGGLVIGGVLISTAPTRARAKSKKCGPCKTRVRGKCKVRKWLNNTVCNGDGLCVFGTCNPPPTCLRSGMSCSTLGPNTACCSGVCGPSSDPTFRCTQGTAGDPCGATWQCSSHSCIGYRCQ